MSERHLELPSQRCGFFIFFIENGWKDNNPIDDEVLREMLKSHDKQESENEGDLEICNTVSVRTNNKAFGNL